MSKSAGTTHGEGIVPRVRQVANWCPDGRGSGPPCTGRSTEKNGRACGGSKEPGLVRESLRPSANTPRLAPPQEAGIIMEREDHRPKELEQTGLTKADGAKGDDSRSQAICHPSPSLP